MPEELKTNAWQALLKPELKVDGHRLCLQVKTFPAPNRFIGKRIARARKMYCKLVNRRSPDWSHYEYQKRPLFTLCGCRSQAEIARAFGVHQTVIHHIEYGTVGKDRRPNVSSLRVDFPRKMDLAAFVRVFGEDLTFWIISGQKPERYLGKDNLLR